jgi:iron complex outermembrane receptor protein
MKLKDNALLGVAMLAMLSPAAAQAPAQTQNASADSETLAIEDIVVLGERVARGNNVITADRIEDLPAGQNIVDAIKLVPGVSIRGSDALNNDPWTYAINIRGFEVNQRSSKIGQTLDGVPLFNGSYYLGGSPAQKYITNESVSRIDVSQGTADVGSPAANALGGTLAYFSRDPSEEAAGLARVTLGDFDSQRFYGRYDFGQIFPNTRAYVAGVQLDTRLWPHGGATPAGIEQFAIEGKSVSEFGPLTMTLFASYNDSDDDPIIETSRSTLNRQGLEVDGSVAIFNPLSAAANETWADDWAAIRENTFAYAKFDWRLSDTLSIDVTPYAQRNDGVGEFLPPGLQPRIVTDAGGVRRQVLFGDGASRARTATFQNSAGNAVFNYVNGVADSYVALDGTTVTSAACYNVDGTARLTNGQPTCAQGQSYRNSLYYHRRTGLVVNGALDLGAHSIRAGVWYENLDRDFGREWLRYADIRTGPVILGNSVYRKDFEQNFVTDLYKFYIADDWTVSDRLTISAGLQHFLVDISGQTRDESRYAANGTFNGFLNSSVESNSEELLPSIGAVYDFTDQFQLFAGYSKNFGAVGDWALEKTGTDFANLDPEVTENLEIGARYNGSRVAASATLFRTENDDAIVFLDETFAAVTGGINYNVGTGGTYVNAPGGVKTSGVEASALVDFTDAFSGYLALTLLDSEYSAAFNAANYGGSRRTQVQAGNKVPGTPDVLVGVALNYEEGPFKGSLSGRYTGESEGDAQNRPDLVVPSYTLVDLSASYRLPIGGDDGRRYIEAQVSVNNILDERYIAGILDEFNQRYTVGAPRTTYFTLSVGF